MMTNTEAEAQQPRYRVPWWTTLIDALIIVTVTALLTYTYAFQPVEFLKVAVGVLLGLIVLIYIILAYRIKPRPLSAAPGRRIASKLILIDEEGESLKEWYVQGETSLVIGKSSPQEEVDIDLSDTEYASLISSQHAVLNYAAGKWYVEDADSRNGIGLRRASSSAVQRMDPEKPHEVGVGDMLYIANTRIILK